MDPYSAVGAGYAAANKPLSIARTFDENARGAVRSSDIVISATQVKSGGTGAVILAYVPDGENWRIEYLAARNITIAPSAAASTLGVYLVPDGGSVSTTLNAVYLASIASGVSVRITEAEGYQLLPGERLAATCTADNDIIIFARLRRITQGDT